MHNQTQLACETSLTLSIHFITTTSNVHRLVTNDGLIHKVQGYDAERSELSLAHVALQEGHLGVGVEEEVGEETSKSGLAEVGLPQEQDGCSWCVYEGGGGGE